MILMILWAWTLGVGSGRGLWVWALCAGVEMKAGWRVSSGE